MKNTNWLKEMSWTEFDERRKNCDTVIIPGGAIEVYGPHMPLGSDSIVSAAICELVAQKVNAVIGPMIEVGESASLYQFPGTQDHARNLRRHYARHHEFNDQVGI